MLVIRFPLYVTFFVDHGFKLKTNLMQSILLLKPLYTLLSFIIQVGD